MKTFPMRFLVPLLLAFALLGCVKVKTEVEPIDITITVRLKIDRELDEFFGELDAKDATIDKKKETGS